MRGLVAGLVLVALSACAPTARTIVDQFGREVTIVDTGIDPAGGVRLTAIGQFDTAGKYTVLTAAQGPGTLQTVLPSALAAAGFVGGMQLLRPAEFNNQTSVNATNSGITAASNPATKISASTAANNAGGSAAGAMVSGGQGGAGGQGGVGGTGGNPTAAANPTATASPTIAPTIAPTVNSSNTTSPMFAPQFSPVQIGGTSTSTGGSATANPTNTLNCQGNCAP